MRYSARVTTLMQLLDIWESPRLLALRVVAASKLLPNVLDDLRRNQTSKYPRYDADTTDLDGLLDFFETVAFFTRWRFSLSFPFVHTPVLDLETTWDISDGAEGAYLLRHKHARLHCTEGRASADSGTE